MGKLTLTYKYDGKTIVHELDHAGYLPDTLEAFEYFLRGCGFHFSGSLDIVADEYLAKPFSLEDDDYSVDDSADNSGDTSSEDSSADNSGDSNEKEEQ